MGCNLLRRWVISDNRNPGMMLNGQGVRWALLDCFMCLSVMGLEPNPCNLELGILNTAASYQWIRVLTLQHAIQLEFSFSSPSLATSHRPGPPPLLSLLSLVTCLRQLLRLLPPPTLAPSPTSSCRPPLPLRVAAWPPPSWAPPT